MVDGHLEQVTQLQFPVEEESRIYLNMKLLAPGHYVKELEKHNVHIGSRADEVKITPSFYNAKKVVDVFLEKIKT